MAVIQKGRSINQRKRSARPAVLREHKIQCQSIFYKKFLDKSPRFVYIAQNFLDKYSTVSKQIMKISLSTYFVNFGFWFWYWYYYYARGGKAMSGLT